jgi:hypothetical protein
MQKIFIFLGIFFCFLFLIVVFIHPAVLDFDLGRHLLFGKQMLENHQIINTNLLSYTNPDFHYVNSHWLSEILFYLILAATGFNGLILFTAAISLLTFSLLFVYCLKRFNLFGLLLSSIICVKLLSSRIDIRPELFSYLFLAIFLVILFKFREKYSKLIFLLIPIELVWTNLHINFAVGILLIGLFLVDNLWSNKLRLVKSGKTIFAVFVLSLASTIINPNLINGAIFPLTFNSNYAFPILENQSIFYLSTLLNYQLFIGVETVIISLFILLFYYRKKAYLIDWLLFFTFSLGIILAIRNISLFALAIFIPLTRALGFLFKDLSIFLEKNLSRNKLNFLKIFAIFCLNVAILGSIIKVLSYQEFGLGTVESGKKAVDFYLKNKLTGPIYNNFDAGQYLAYRLFPQEKVFMDGRPEAYPKDFFLKIYNPAQESPQDFEKISQKYKFNVIFMFHYFQSSENLSYLLNNSGYKLVYLDDTSLIMLRNNSQNKNIIAKNLITEKSFTVPKIQDKKKLFSYIVVFQKIGWDNQEKIAYAYLHQLDPTDCYLRETLNQFRLGYKLLKNIKLDTTNACP